MRKFGLLLVSFLAVSSVFAQQITGNVKDQQGKALAGSTISLLNAKDSSVSKLAVSNNEGHFSFNGTKTGHYLVSASHVGYAPAYSAAFESSGAGETNVPALQMNKMAGELKAVVVNSKKPIVEVKADRTILNVESQHL